MKSSKSYVVGMIAICMFMVFFMMFFETLGLMTSMPPLRGTGMIMGSGFDGTEQIWPIDAVATVAVGDFFVKSLLPMWIRHVRDEAGWAGRMIVGYHRPQLPEILALLRHEKNFEVIPISDSTKPTLAGREVKVLKLALILKIDNPHIHRVLYIDVDAMATNHLHAWVRSLSGGMDQKYQQLSRTSESSAPPQLPSVAADRIDSLSIADPPSAPQQVPGCAVPLFTTSERLLLADGAPFNTGVFVAHTACSRPCFEAVIEIHRRAKRGEIEYTWNDQDGLIHLWRQGLCPIEQISAAMQEFEAGLLWSIVSNPASILYPPALKHFTRAENRIAKCNEESIDHSSTRDMADGPFSWLRREIMKKITEHECMSYKSKLRLGYAPPMRAAANATGRV